eukprot:2693450-Rhodomonas_salina.1
MSRGDAQTCGSVERGVDVALRARVRRAELLVLLVMVGLGVVLRIRTRPRPLEVYFRDAADRPERNLIVHLVVHLMRDEQSAQADDERCLLSQAA